MTEYVKKEKYMKILLSIKPQFVKQIERGEKKFEFRRSLPKRQDIDRIVVYASSPICKLVGEIEIAEILVDSLDNLWKYTGDKSGLSKSEFYKYFNGKEKANAFKIKKFIPYSSPKAIKEIYPNKVAPQSFCYVL